MKTIKTQIYIIYFSFLLIGCGKDFLDIKRNSNQVVPKTAKDYLAILARSNMYFTSSDLLFLGSDEYYVRDGSDLIAGSQFTPIHQFVYTWADDPYGNQIGNRDWEEAYERIMYANLALDVESVPLDPSEASDTNRVRVAARFHRAWNYYHLAQAFCKVYDAGSADRTPGLPLRLDYDVSEKYDRSTLQEVYDLIIKDLTEAEQMSVSIDDNPYMPGMLAVRALLARVYLQLGKYDIAMQYADRVLEKKNVLIDYNTLEGTISDVYGSYFEPFGKNNPSIIFYSSRAVGGIMGSTRINVDSLFVNALEKDDLRRKAYFFTRSDGTTVYIGAYCGYGGSEFFTGLSVEEMLLIRAECRARLGFLDQAVLDINILRRKRFKSENYVDIQSGDIDDLLGYTLKERHKELFLRGRRWEDARRLNREGKYPIAFRRVLDGSEYMLKPNEKNWIWPIPKNEIENNGIGQNER